MSNTKTPAKLGPRQTRALQDDVESIYFWALDNRNILRAAEVDTVPDLSGVDLHQMESKVAAILAVAERVKAQLAKANA